MSNIYNFYCLKTLAKPFYRTLINPRGYYNIKFHNFDFCGITSIFKRDDLIITEVDLQYKKQRFLEKCLYSSDGINYDLSIFNNNQLDNKVKIVNELRDELRDEFDKIEPDFWLNLSIQNQKDISKIYNNLEFLA
jgi:hypothetical protein